MNGLLEIWLKYFQPCLAMDERNAEVTQAREQPSNVILFMIKSNIRLLCLSNEEKTRCRCIVLNLSLAQDHSCQQFSEFQRRDEQARTSCVLQYEEKCDALPYSSLSLTFSLNMSLKELTRSVEQIIWNFTDDDRPSSLQHVTTLFESRREEEEEEQHLRHPIRVVSRSSKDIYRSRTESCLRISLEEASFTLREKRII